MYIAFTEEQAQEIRSIGISVIEFKNCIKKGFDVVIYVINKTFNAVQDALEIMSNLIVETVDSIDLFLNEFFDECGAQTSRRYRFVKILGNMGCDKQRVWRATRHTWLARSHI